MDYSNGYKLPQIAHYSQATGHKGMGVQGAMRVVARALGQSGHQGFISGKGTFELNDVRTSTVGWRCVNCSVNPEDELMKSWLR